MWPLISSSTRSSPPPRTWTSSPGSEGSRTTPLGTAFAITGGISPTGDWGDTGATTYGRSASGDTSAAVGLSLSDLGVTIGQTVTKFVFTAVKNWDITEIMVDGDLDPSGTLIMVE